MGTAIVEFVPHAHASQRRMTRLEAIQCNGARLPMPFQCLPEEDACSRQITTPAQIGGDRSSPFVDSSVQIHPATFYLDIGSSARQDLPTTSSNGSHRRANSS